jgi:alpha-ketoglutarate-dependent taurine dioxygenase
LARGSKGSIWEPLSGGDFRSLLRASGQYGVLCFPRQTFDTAAFAAFARLFGDLEVNVANQFHEPDFPEIMVLSNQMRPDGKPAGANDAGQGWHTDMPYSADIALAMCCTLRRCRRGMASRSGRLSSATCMRHMMNCRAE